LVRSERARRTSRCSTSLDRLTGDQESGCVDWLRESSSKPGTGCDPSSRKRGASGDGVSKRSRRLGLGPGIHGTIGTEPRTCSDAPPLFLTWEPVVESCPPLCVGDEG